MEIKQAEVLDFSEPLSKAIAKLSETPAVIVTKGGRYHGIIDHRCITTGLGDPSKMRCDTVIVKPPTMLQSAELMERVSAFLLGHFKALPVIDHQDTPIGITTRVELLKELHSTKNIPKGNVDLIMNSPVYQIAEDESIGKLKKLLKEKNARRLVVTSKDAPIGVVSTFDIGPGTFNPSLGSKDIRSNEIDLDKMKIRDFLRPDITVVTESESISGAAKKMIEKQVSSVIVTADGKPVGILSALDIFKKIQDMNEEKLQIHISGLSKEDKGEYSHIEEKIGSVIKKFQGSFNIRNISIHTKEGKSTVTVNVYFDTDNGHISLKGERATIKETIDELSDELDALLRKRKDQKISAKYYKESF